MWRAIQQMRRLAKGNYGNLATVQPQHLSHSSCCKKLILNIFYPQERVSGAKGQNTANLMKM